MTRCLTAICLLLAAGLLVGCGKRDISLRFTNQTDRDVEVRLSGPGEPTGLLGAAPAGKTLERTLTVFRGKLPAGYRWSAGKYSGGFVIQKRGSEKVDVAIGPEPPEQP